MALFSTITACGGEGAPGVPEECPSPPCDFQAERLFALGDDDLGVVGASPSVARIGSFYYVTDQDSRYTIQVFHPDSGFVGSIGNQGQGPEEFARINDVDADSDGNLWILDMGNARISVARPSGAQPEFLHTFRLPQGVQQRFRNGMTLIAGGKALLNSEAFVNNEITGASTYLIDQDGIEWSVNEDSLNAPGSRSRRRVYALDDQNGYWTAPVGGPYRLEYRRLSDGGLVRSITPRRPWYDEHPEDVRLPPRPGDPPGPDGDPPYRVQQAASIHDISVRGDQLWVIGSFDNLSHAVLDVFRLSDGALLYERGLELSHPPYSGYFHGFDDDGLVIEYVGGDRPSRLTFWRMTLN